MEFLTRNKGKPFSEEQINPLESIKCASQLGCTMAGSKRLEASSSSKESFQTSAPADCASRDRASDAADAMQEMASMMNQMDPGVLRKLVQAREAALNLDKIFPGGDRRFDPIDSDDEDGDEEEEEHNAQQSKEGIGGFEEPCQGLLDERVDPSPSECLSRAKTQYDFDLVGEMDKGGLDFFQRIRLVNHIRKLVKEGMDAVNVVEGVRSVIEKKSADILNNDSLLEPVVSGDLLLTALESEESDEVELDKGERVIDAVEKSLREAKILQ